jgi:hypothetical protein
MSDQMDELRVSGEAEIPGTGEMLREIDGIPEGTEAVTRNIKRKSSKMPYIAIAVLTAIIVFLMVLSQPPVGS